MTGRVALPRERAQIKEKTAALMAETEKRILAEEDYFIRLADENHKRFMEREAQRVQREQTRIPQKTAPKMTRKQTTARLRRKLWCRFMEGLATGAATAVIVCWLLIRAGVIG